MLSDIRGWLSVLSDVVTIVSPLLGWLIYRAGARSRVSERKFRLRIWGIELVSIRKDGDHSR